MFLWVYLYHNFLLFQVIEVIVDLVANHKGFFAFALCQNNDPLKDPGQVTKLLWNSINGSYCLESFGQKNIEFSEDKKTIWNLSILISFFDHKLD